MIILKSRNPPHNRHLSHICSLWFPTLWWGGYDERLLFVDNRTDNLPTCRRVSISFSYALLLSNITLPRSTRGRCCWPEPRDKEKTKNTGWHLQLGLPPPLLDMTLGCNSPLPINYSQEKTWGWNYMFVLPCWQNRLNIHTHTHTFCRSNMQIVTPHCTVVKKEMQPIHDIFNKTFKTNGRW